MFIQEFIVHTVRLMFTLLLSYCMGFFIISYNDIHIGPFIKDIVFLSNSRHSHFRPPKECFVTGVETETGYVEPTEETSFNYCRSK